MIYHLSLSLRQYMHCLNVLHYTSFRIMAALLSALVLFFLCGSWFIAKSRIWFRSPSREYTPQNHRAKDGMPTMGGIFILAVVIVSSMLWCRWDLPQVWIFLATLVGFGTIGFWDDWCKIKYRKGISEKRKFCAQIIIATFAISAWLFFCKPETTLCLPLLKNICPNISWLFVPWCVFLLVGTSNAVNLTDGLDGLAIGSLISNFATYTGLLYLSGHALFAAYLHIPFTGNTEIAVIGASLVGASLGFLWYNTYPAQIFMGDVGSLFLGAALAFMALMTKQELLLPLTGGLFVLETVSVIIQVLSYKLRGKRVFKMAPIHHHFELIGWQEAKITVRFAIITLVLCLIALMTIKMR